MDESAYTASRGARVAQPCVFERALLARCVDCGLAARHALAEREAIACVSATAHANCATLLGMLRERAAFALKAGPPGGPLPHATAMKLLCGGLHGLRQVTDPDGAPDVHALVVAAQQRHGSLSGIPWPGVVAAVVAWRGPRRRGSGA
jgi:hypothetical protein